MIPFICRNLDPLLAAWLGGNQEMAAAALNQYIDWTPEAAAALQESVLGGDLFTVCSTDDSVSNTCILKFNSC